MSRYNPADIEPRWQAYWSERKTFAASNVSEKPKYYTLSMFPYPSGSGLHVGHPESYTAIDIVARYKRMKGFNVLNPMGWDAFGLPAERAAVRENRHPAEITAENIAYFKNHCCGLASPSIGIEKFQPPVPTTTDGPSGYFSNSMNKDWLIYLKCQ